jgi:hypothetical protein
MPGPSGVELPADFLATFRVDGHRITGTDLAIFLASLSHLPMVEQSTREAAVDTAAKSNVAVTAHVPRPDIAAAMGRMAKPRFVKSVTRLQHSTIRLAEDESDFLDGVPALVGHSMLDGSATGAAAIELMHVHPVLAAWAGRIDGKPTVSLDFETLNKLSSRYSVLLYSRLCAAEVIGWNTAFDVQRFARDIVLQLRIPIDMMYDFLGLDIRLAESQVKQVWEIVKREFFKSGYKVKFFPLKANGELVGIQITVVYIKLEGSLHEIEMYGAAQEASSRKGAAIRKQRRARKISY